jgi:hypothetical protein
MRGASSALAGRAVSAAGQSARRSRQRRAHYHHYRYEYASSAGGGDDGLPALVSGPQSRTWTCGLAVFGALCVYVVYQVTTDGGGGWYDVGAGPGLSKRCPSDEFVAMLTRHATPDRHAIYSSLVLVHLSVMR